MKSVHGGDVFQHLPGTRIVLAGKKVRKMLTLSGLKLVAKVYDFNFVIDKNS